MKHTLSILMIILFANFSNAQSKDYQELWAKVEKFEIEGLLKSALKTVEDISIKATKDKNTPQLIKTMFFKSKFALVLEEDAQLNIINDFKNQIKRSDFPTKNILENILANLYWQYFNQNRWQFYNRTKTDVKVDTIDFRTWDLQTLFNDIHRHYLNSLQNGLMLQLEPLGNYDDIFANEKASKTFRPTLFDFLSHNALEFYKTNETHITKPAYKFEIDNKNLLGDAVSFSNIKLEAKDSTSLQLHTLKIYQSLIQFHLKDKSPFALADANIQRLKFVNKHATFNKKQTILLDAFKSESEQLKKHRTSALYDFEIASIYFQQGQTFQPKSNEDTRWKLKEALDLCNTVISKFPKSKGAEKCSILKDQITQQSLQITTEQFLSIQQNARLLVRYKNIEKLEFKIYKISRNQLVKFNKIYRKEDKLKFIKKLKGVVTNWDSSLRNEKDYQVHSTEVVLPKLNNGTYLVYASQGNDENTTAYSTIQFTNLALVESDTENYKTFQIIDRNNGKPISNATIELTYAEKTKKGLRSEKLVTDKNGQVKIKKNDERFRNVGLKVTHGNDIAFFGNYYINRHYKQSIESADYNAFLFTDRSIYRPGQTVYFKGIVMKTEDDKSIVTASELTIITLYNSNDEKIKELELKTNEFGSVSGEFILPSTGLNGQYYIELDGDEEDFYLEHYFSVEEYKRPKFETKFNTITKTYKINDSVTIKGNALAYAGSNITDAKVVYRVHRKVEYPRWYFWYRPWLNSEPQEITHGQSITNDKGEFEITFKAQPDQSVDKNSLPIFKYEVTADVTDLNGETRSTTTIVNVGYHALTANMAIANLLDKTKKTHAIEIDTKNLNGEFVSAKGTVKIYKLLAPNSVLRQRPWAAPDYQDISEKDYKNLFPHDAYSNEQNSNNWKKGKLVFISSFNTENSKKLNLGKTKKWESGQYIITLESKDKFGQLVKDEIKTTLYSGNDKTLADHKLFSITSNESNYNAGDIAIITLASASANLNTTVTIEKNHEIIKTQIVQLNNNKQTISIPVTSDDIGGFSVNYSFAAYNSFQSGSLNISVPYPKTDLEIETTTFRDKLQPGTDETWSFKIKGPKGDKVSAELLASMYDASLDQFKSHNWNFNPINNPTYYSYNQSNARQSFGTENFRVYQDRIRMSYPQQYYDQLDWFGFHFGNGNKTKYYMKSLNRRVSSPETIEINSVAEESYLDEVVIVEDRMEVDEELTRKFGGLQVFKEASSDTGNSTIEEIEYKEKSNFDNIKIRKNLQETAFFFPELKTDEDGNVSFSFTTPEALTQWKLQLLAHTKTLESATKTLTTVTQKELMVIPNAPRFLREGDNITISTKIANLTDKQLSGDAILILTDAISGKDISSKLFDVERSRNDHLKNTSTSLSAQGFEVDAKGNTQVSWDLSIPDGVQAVQYKVIAKSEYFSDGEQNALPVLSNRMLVTETLPMWIRSNQTKTFTLDKLKNVSSSSLKHHKLTLEMTSNPAWYAVQALPYLMEYPYECNEQTFSRYYANALASHIANSNPRIQEVFNQWKSQDVLISNLEKNAELKSILIQETPWLRDAQSETEQKKRIALLFDLNKMNNELQSAKRKLKQNQMSSGGWSWFKGGLENRYITQHIITGFGHLNKLNVIQGDNEESMIKKAINYLDAEFVKEYNDIRKYDSKVDLKKDHLSYTQLHYLYMRSFYPEIKKSNTIEEITKYYHTQIQKYWLKRSLYAKGLMALVVDRLDDKKMASKILKSLKETSITSEELGMYWKTNSNSWYWYQAPIETQALLIEAFAEIENDTKTIDNLKIWLLKNKQTNRWKTTKATTDAVYALLLQGSDWLSVTDMVEVVLGGQKIEPSKLEDVKVEAGTGYFKTSWNSSEIKSEMADVQITKKGNGIAWGSLYWQYFEDLDKITSAETPLKLKKKLFLKSNTDTGEKISEITAETKVNVGDLVRVRIELRSDRAMEFIHMKDMRASGLEPVNVISKYKWQDGLGYYESTKDTSTNFFFDYLPKGVYVFEYDLRVNNAGDMSNGITTIQSMYAPEFSSHSEGVRISVD